MSVVEYYDFAGRGMAIRSGNFSVWGYSSSLIEDPNWSVDAYDSDTLIYSGSFNSYEWFGSVFVDYYGGSYAYIDSMYLLDENLNWAFKMYEFSIQFDLYGDYTEGATFYNMFSGSDQFYGNSYADYIECGGGNDAAYGNSGNDKIFGQNGNDSLDGGNNNDVLNGGIGTDTLIGDTGKDRLTGGSGADRFIFRSVSESATGAATADVIADFVTGSDKMDFSALDAFAGTGTNDTFVWRGTAAFNSTTQGEVRYQKFDNSGTTNDYTMVYVDNDGDAGVEMAIRLAGLYNLTASDFIL